MILKDGQTILRASEVDGYKHIYKLGFDGKATQITKGSWDVIDFLGIDESSNTIYYSSAELSSIQKSIYSIQLDGTNKIDLTKEAGYNEAEFCQA